MYSNDYVVCAFASDSSFRLSIPMHASPTFHTDTCMPSFTLFLLCWLLFTMFKKSVSVHLKWRLRFEFVTSAPLINVVYGEVCKAPIGKWPFIMSRLGIAWVLARALSETLSSGENLIRVFPVFFGWSRLHEELQLDCHTKFVPHLQTCPSKRLRGRWTSTCCHAALRMPPSQTRLTSEAHLWHYSDLRH